MVTKDTWHDRMSEDMRLRDFRPRTQTWTEALVAPGHVSLHGGFDCANG